MLLAGAAALICVNSGIELLPPFAGCAAATLARGPGDAFQELLEFAAGMIGVAVRVPSKIGFPFSGTTGASDPEAMFGSRISGADSLATLLLEVLLAQFPLREITAPDFTLLVLNATELFTPVALFQFPLGFAAALLIGGVHAEATPPAAPPVAGTA